jgi:hypothetical protein
MNDSGVSYVMPRAVIGSGTRRSVKERRGLKVLNVSKGPVLFKRFYSSLGSSSGFIGNVAQELNSLELSSKSNDKKKVDVTVRGLLSSSDFWVHCYESIKSKPGASALGGGKVSSDAETFDGINLNYFDSLSKNICSGKFYFGSTRQVAIPKKGEGIRILGIADSRDKIVQKGMSILLELTSEHRFYENSFGFRRGKSAHDAISFIKTKVPSGS